MNRASLDKQPGEVAAMFDGVAATLRPDQRRAVPGSGPALAQGGDPRGRPRSPAQVVLDLAAGTGTSSEPFDAAGAHVVPADFSLGMLRVGKRRRPDLGFSAADATRLPFADDAFDAVTISFGLRNVVDVRAALRELRRVTRPGGRLVVCEFSQPVWTPFRTVYVEYLMRALPAGRAARSAPTRTPTSTWPSRSRPGRTSARSPTQIGGEPAGSTSSGATCRAASSRCTGRVGLTSA